MSSIEQIDTHFAGAQIQTQGIRFYDVRKAPFSVHGLYRPQEEGKFRRMPEETAEKISDGVKALHTHTAGGRIRFRTDARRILLACTLPSVTRFPHMPITGVSCLDLYADGRFVKPFIAGVDALEKGGYAAQIALGTARMRDILIHFPLYNEVSQVMIGLDEAAAVEKSAPYAVERPVVYYGSSITQGGCASHAGNSYPAILSRRLDCDFINLGFSGSARAEEEMARYIAGLDMCVLVYDYDHNAPDPAYLGATHERFFQIIRQAQRKVPIVMLSAVDGCWGRDIACRREIIRRTWENAVAAGDTNAYFIDGQEAFAAAGRDLCTVDGTHPNDLGFWCMAQALEGTLRRLLYA